MSRKRKDLQRNYTALTVVFLLLIVIGAVNVFSTTFVADRVAGNMFSHLIRQIAYICFGAIPAIVLFRQDYHWLDKHKGILIGLTVLFLFLVLVPGVGINVNGARRWLGYGPVTFQPSELAKLVGILYAASCLSKLVKNGKAVEFFYPLSESRRASLWQRMRTMPNPALWVPLLFVLFVGLQPDMGTAAVIFAIPALMTACGGARITKAKVPILLAVALVVLYISIAPYRLNRIVSYYDPWSYEKTLGYQTVQSLIAIGSSGFLGQGIGNGVSKFSYLPEAHTDFAFAIFAQEWGVFGSLFMVGLFAALLIFGIFTATRAADAYGLFLSMGITMYIGLQGFVNLAMVCGTLPVVGVPLPFVSYGGTSLIVNMSAAALLLNVARQNLRDSRKAPPAAEREKLPSIKEETRSRFPLH